MKSGKLMKKENSILNVRSCSCKKKGSGCAFYFRGTKTRSGISFIVYKLIVWRVINLKGFMTK